MLCFGSEIPWKPNSKQTRTLSGETRGGWNLLEKAHGITKSPEVKDLPRSTEGPRGAVTALPRSPAVPCPTPEGLRADRGLTVNPPVPSRCSKGSEQPRHRHVPPSLSASGRAVPARILPDRNTAGLSHGAEERDSGMGGRIRQVPLVTIQRWQEGRALPVPSLVPHPRHGAEHGGTPGLAGRCRFQGPCGHGDKPGSLPSEGPCHPTCPDHWHQAPRVPQRCPEFPQPTLTGGGEK